MPPDRDTGHPRLVLSVALAVIGMANLVALWAKRGHYVGGWELFGPTYGIMALNQHSLGGALQTVAEMYLRQRDRLGYTGAESFVYTLVPGALDRVLPWLLWTQLLTFVLVAGTSWWLLRRLGIRPVAYVASFLASAALTSYVIVGYPYLSSTIAPYALAIAFVLAPSRSSERGVWSLLVDVLAFGAITAVAYDGYEIGKTFFVVPLAAALALPGITVPRRVRWVAIAVGLGWLGLRLRPMSTTAALDAVPMGAAFLTGIVALVRRYFWDWYIDFPAIGVAGVIALLGLRERRPFWVALMLFSSAILSLSAFQFEGRFLIPQRFLLFAFLSALVTSLFLSRGPRGRWATRIVVALLGVGIVHTTWATVRFVQTTLDDERRDWNGQRVYPLPYQHANLDWHVWRDRVHDAEIVSSLARSGGRVHLLFYGFSALGEDPVNPQVLPARVLVNVGYRRFASQIHFFDHLDHMWFRFPIEPMADVRRVLAQLRPPFFVHVREPEHSAADLLAKYLNRSTVEPVALGLRGFVSYRVDDYVPAEAIVVRKLPADEKPRLANAAPGLCRTAWTPAQPGESVVHHLRGALSTRISEALVDPSRIGVERRIATVPVDAAKRPFVVHYRGYVDNPTADPMPMTIDLRADDEVALTVNGQAIVESLRRRPATSYAERLLLPTGLSRVDFVYHKFFDAGAAALAMRGADGELIAWRCPLEGDVPGR